ncbi:type II secretion system F family protein [Halopenitus sp. H-Gu1]|uniref:type II secretion system F family protein n=1 Tax=Halopenitus sp. H-Gu1 TaxID=3242697 RepID=UPI00359E57F7
MSEADRGSKADGQTGVDRRSGSTREPGADRRSNTVGGPRDRANDRLSAIDRGLYALFARHADAARHAGDRHRYRGTRIQASFEVFLARVYAVSWIGGVLAAVPAVIAITHLSPVFIRRLDAALAAGVPGGTIGLTSVSRGWLAAAIGIVVATAAKRGIVRLGGSYLRWLTAARRNDIEHTLPGAVRYLHALSSGSDTARGMLRKTAANEAYGETATSFRAALNSARLTGSLDLALGRVARDTPSRDLLAPFLLKFREHANQGEDALTNYLRMEGRMLGLREDRARKRAEGFLELLSELFIVLLVLPALLVIILSIIGVIAPGLSEPIATPIGSISTRAVLTYGSGAFILGVGLASAAAVEQLRPSDQRTSYERPEGPIATLRSAPNNPASAAVVLAIPSILLTAGFASGGVDPVNVALFGYLGFALPVGVISVRRARLDDAKDREIKDFVHAVSGHVSLGRPFPEAVALVARDVDLGALNDDVADLAFNLSLTTGAGSRDGDYPESESPAAASAGGTAERGSRETLRTAALNRFVDTVGTPLAEQTVGLITGALDAGSDTETVFETLQTEIGRLYHQKRALRSAMLVYVAVGWTAALLVIGIVVAVNVYVIDGFAQLSAVSGSGSLALDPGSIQPERERYRFYVVMQATMLASGWFAGAASRGYYEALLHSGALVGVCYLIFAGTGLL